MEALPEAWFEILVKDAGPGGRYQFVIDGDLATPDPAARYQPGDVHGQSEIVDLGFYRWQCSDWKGRPWHESVFYELHVGSFSEEGTFEGIERKLDYLVDLGITAIELMPVSDFPGTRNWGYDGVLHFAPDAQYGTPEDLKRLIDTAHAKGLMVFLDVVYNHFGPDGNYLHVYAREFFTDRHQTPWGAAIDFERKEVRQFFIENVLYWINEFRFDGLRFDAVHAIIDEKSPNILEEIAQEVYARTDPERHIHLVLENDDNEARYLGRHEDGAPAQYVAQWNDDIHHVYHVIATGETDGYYEDYVDDPVGRLGRCLTEGFAYQGEASKHRDGIARGEKSSHLPSTAFVNFQQNHDQIGNRAFGERLVKLSGTDALKALSAIALIAPSPPMLFMGEEWGASTPFLFFCDFGEELGNAVREGRKREFSKFALFEAGSAAADIPDPTERETFERSCLNWNEVTLPQHAEWMAHYKTLLHIRNSEIIPRLTISTPNAVSLDRIGKTGLGLSWTLNDKQKLTLLTNLGPEPVAVNARKTEGPTLWSSHPDLSNETEIQTIPAWFVLWTLQ
jgi:malto-oligosyltrehalose trehalohydrolase